MCPNSKITSKGTMDLRLFEKIVDQIRYSAKAIHLYLVGEPLLQKNIVRMIRYCKQNTRASVTISTNATLLNNSLAQRLIDSGLDEIILCLDGNSAQTYEQIRRGARFAEVSANIANFIRLKGERDKPKCIVQLIAMYLNRPEINDFKDRWGDLDCKVSVKWVDTWGCQLPELASMSDSLSPNRQKARIPCADLWFKMAINWRGEVVVCCHDWAGKYVLGNLTYQTVAEVWNGGEIARLRRLQQQRNYDSLALCDNCSEWSTEDDEYAYFAEFRCLERSRP